MKKLILLAGLILLMAMPVVRADYGLNNFNITIVDELGEPISASLTVNVYAADDTNSVVTIYANAQKTAKSNPITVTNGQMSFYTGAFYLDIRINDSSNATWKRDVSSTTHRIFFVRQDYVNTSVKQYVQTVAYAKLGSTGAGWTIGAADDLSLATLAASQTAEIMIIPITVPLRVGDTITAWTINGQIDSAGNAATLDGKLYKHTEATAGGSATAVGSGMTQLSKTADYKVANGESSLTEVVAADESFFLLVTGTTGSTTDIEIAGITVTVSGLW